MHNNWQHGYDADVAQYPNRRSNREFQGDNGQRLNAQDNGYPVEQREWNNRFVGKRPTESFRLADFMVASKTKPGQHSKSAQDMNDSHRIPDSAATLMKTPEAVHGNVLDTSQPTFHRGKHRDTPKLKSTTMKKVKNYIHMYCVFIVIKFRISVLSSTVMFRIKM